MPGSSYPCNTKTFAVIVSFNFGSDGVKPPWKLTTPRMFIPLRAISNTELPPKQNPIAAIYIDRINTVDSMTF